MRKTKKENADIIWETRFLLAQQFYKEQGHLLIPHDYVRGNVKLGRWIGTQRQNYFKRDNPFFTQERINKLNTIGMVWDCAQVYWDKLYEELEEYKKIYGNIRVPQDYITPRGNALGSWVNLQRLKYKYGTLTEDKVKKLEILGIIWQPRKLIEQQWEINFRAIKEYKHKYKKLPKFSYIDEKGRRLGEWLSSQRTKYHKVKLLPEREKKLNRIGALNNLYEEIWDKNYERAKSFYKKHNYLPKRYSDNTQLATWLSRQRGLYHKNSLSQLKIEQLEKIGMIWDVKEDYWQKMYARAVDFYKKNGTIYVSKEKSISKDYKLALWLETQRKAYRNNSLYNPERIKMLEDIGFIWNPYKSPDKIWNEWYLKSKQYYLKNGHLTPTKGKLRTWLLAQRAAKKGLRGKISDKQIKLLNNIGMVWDVKKENWAKMYQYAKKYYEIHEMLNIPVNYVTDDGVNLGLWISRQRKIYKEIMHQKLKMNDILRKRIILLNKIGMIWDASKLTTKTSFQEKAIFYYLSKFYSNVEKMTQWEFIGYELDIYIPDIKTAIEYDGIWHKDSLKRDNLKNRACRKHGIRLIRMREISLPKVSYCKDIIDVKSCKDDDLEVAINKLFTLLKIEYTCNIRNDKNQILRIYKDYNSHLFDRCFEKLYLYCRKYGPLSSNTTFAKLDKGLKYWITEQRANYRNGLLTPLQIKKLQQIGFVFDVYEDKWQERYRCAVEYYKDKGNLNIPYKFITNDGVHLGSWLTKQRRLYHYGKLNINRTRLLEELEIDWSFKDNSKTGLKKARLIYIQGLRRYYEIYGNIDIKRSYVSSEGLHLGKWLERRRADYRKGILDEETISVLNELQIKWDIFDGRWNEMFQIAKEYYLKNGNILISANYITDNGVHLGDWVSRQRKKYSGAKKNRPLTKDQIDKLNSLKMMWDPYLEKWMKNYELAKKYYEEHGHLNIPVGYITDTGVKLGMWLGVQRQANRGNPNYLMTPERKKLLDDIKMNWELRYQKLNARKRDNIR